MSADVIFLVRTVVKAVVKAAVKAVVTAVVGALEAEGARGEVSVLVTETSQEMGRWVRYTALLSRHGRC